jgi:NADH:ubiquinone oxidoreductase subunit H
MTAWAWIGTILAVLAGLWAACAYAIWYERRYLARPPFAGLTRRGALWPLAALGRPLAKPDLWPAPVRRRRAYAAAIVTLLAILGALALLWLGPIGARVSGADYGWLWGWQSGAALSLPLSLLLAALATAAAYAVGRVAPEEWPRAASRAMGVQSLRAALPAVLALGALALVAGTMNVARLALDAHGAPLLLYQPLGALVAAIALVQAAPRLPFSLPGEERSVRGDFQLQHAGRLLALVHLAERLGLIWAATLLATLYLGGWWGPGGLNLGWLALKTAVVAALLLWLRERWLRGTALEPGRRQWWLLALLALANAALTTALVLWVV